MQLPVDLIQLATKIVYSSVESKTKILKCNVMIVGLSTFPWSIVLNGRILMTKEGFLAYGLPGSVKLVSSPLKQDKDLIKLNEKQIVVSNNHG